MKHKGRKDVLMMYAFYNLHKIYTAFPIQCGPGMAAQGSASHSGNLWRNGYNIPATYSYSHSDSY